MLKLSKKNIILTIAVTLFANAAYCKDISYDYIQGTYSSVTIDLGGSDWDGDGYGVSGSFSMSDNIALSASYGATNYDTLSDGFDSLGLDTTDLGIGIIAHTKISPTTDVYGGIALINSEVEFTGSVINGSGDDTGNALSVGVRSMVSDKFELNAAATRVDIFDETENSYSFGTQVYVNETLSIGMAYIIGDDVDTLAFNLRVDL